MGEGETRSGPVGNVAVNARRQGMGGNRRKCRGGRDINITQERKTARVQRGEIGPA